MKKKLLAAALIGLAAIGITACGGNGGGDGDGALSTALDPIAEKGSKMTNEELLAEAKKESGKFIAYGNTSRIKDAVNNFVAKYGAELGLNADNAIGSKKSDTETFTLLGNEAASANNSEGASMTLIQDSATLDLYRKNSDILTNYHSNLFDSKLDANELVPLANQYINKLFMWNNVEGEVAPKFTNVWELLDAKYKNRIYFKAPEKEAVNKNFLMTLTSPSWVTKMEKAYKDYYGKDFQPTGELKNASYAWIKGFLQNADTTSFGGDTDIANGLSKPENSGKVGLFVLSKLRSSSVLSDNLTVGAWEQESITPFAGFMYGLYAQLATHGPRPYTAMLFTNYLMTEEGFKPWASSIGGYSANKDVPVHDGDKDLSFYKNTLVMEDGKWINEVQDELSPWIDGIK